jgi:hypothetical protein
MVAPELKVPVSIEDEMKSSFMDYAMSVIVARALPDARDGLKPVHRRILFAQHQVNNVWNRPYVKCARIVGDVLGKFHPHGDTATYDALVRMAQDFSMRYPLIDGQGNFGSLDGDPPAAYRYTECRMDRLASEMLADIDKETVDWQPNYDDKEIEPVVLPTRSRTSCSTAPPASPSAWPPISRRTTWARSSRPPSRSFATPTCRSGSWCAWSPAPISRRGPPSTAGAASSRPTRPAAARSSCAARPSSRR